MTTEKRMAEASITAFYQTMGISKEVCAFGEKVLSSLKERFTKIDETAEYNQMKVCLLYTSRCV